MAQIKLAKFGSVDMDFVLGVGGYDLERSLSNLCVFVFFAISNLFIHFKIILLLLLCFYLLFFRVLEKRDLLRVFIDSAYC